MATRTERLKTGARKPVAKLSAGRAEFFALPTGHVAAALRASIRRFARSPLRHHELHSRLSQCSRQLLCRLRIGYQNLHSTQTGNLGKRVLTQLR